MNRVRANQIVSMALKTRKKYMGISPAEPVSSYNIAEAMGFDIRFLKIDSFEGMYLAEDKVILISAERPNGRKKFTCAHEIGHHQLVHGTVIDEIIESGSDKEIEKEADFFASMILMPSSAITRAENSSGFNLSTITSSQAYILSKYFGVSYHAFLVQLCYNLKLAPQSIYSNLYKQSPAKIKKEIYSSFTSGDVFVVGNWWNHVAIDIEIGDVILSEKNLFVEGGSILQIEPTPTNAIFQGIVPGISKISDKNGWSSFVRVSKKHYAGMHQFMFEEEA